MGDSASRGRGGGGKSEIWGYAPSRGAEGRAPANGLGESLPETEVLVHSVRQQQRFLNTNTNTRPIA